MGGDSIKGREGIRESYLKLASSGKEEPLTTHSDFFETNFAYVYGSYYKGALVMDQMSYIIGDQALMEGVRRFVEEWKWQHPQGKDFVRCMEKVSDMELDWFFNYWIGGTKTIDYAVSLGPGTNEITLTRQKSHSHADRCGGDPGRRRPGHVLHPPLDDAWGKTTRRRYCEDHLRPVAVAQG